ncbi:MAG: gamma-glutamylcyclotransferase [Rhodospirillales bacterium]|nr:gamma-glutamylcyclotransferase [Rhodospirillales bacterium]
MRPARVPPPVPPPGGAGKSTTLTREFLLSGQLEALVRATMPQTQVFTDAQREASLAQVLAERPADARYAVFGYGSLLWNPTMHVVQRRRVVAQGWHRSFCLLARGGRGTPEHPGLMLGLVAGGTCEGVALDLDPADAPAELAILWRREMVADGYIPRWVKLATPEGADAGWAIAFTINPAGPSYAGDLDEATVIEHLATARGPLGSAADYLFNTRDGLAELGIDDPYLDTLAAKLHARLGR